LPYSSPLVKRIGPQQKGRIGTPNKQALERKVAPKLKRNPFKKALKKDRTPLKKALETIGIF